MNVVIWPFADERYFTLILPSLALLSALYNIFDAAFLFTNVLPTAQVPNGVTLSQLVRPLRSLFQREPSIEFLAWSKSISKLAQLVSNQRDTYRAWVEKDQSITPISDYPEFHAELFVHLEAARGMSAYGSRLDVKARVAVQRFLDSVRAFDIAYNFDPALHEPNVLLRSREWKQVEVAAALLSGFHAGRG